MQGGGGGKNIDPSSALEFIVEVPAQTQTGTEVREGAGQERARRRSPGWPPCCPVGGPSSGCPGLRVTKPHVCPRSSEKGKGERKGEDGSSEPVAKSPRTALGERWGPLCIGGVGGGVAAGQRTLGHIGWKK